MEYVLNVNAIEPAKYFAPTRPRSISRSQQPAILSSPHHIRDPRVYVYSYGWTHTPIHPHSPNTPRIIAFSLSGHPIYIYILEFLDRGGVDYMGGCIALDLTFPIRTKNQRRRTTTFGYIFIRFAVYALLLLARKFFFIHILNRTHPICASSHTPESTSHTCLSALNSVYLYFQKQHTFLLHLSCRVDTSHTHKHTHKHMYIALYPPENGCDRSKRDFGIPKSNPLRTTRLLYV